MTDVEKKFSTPVENKVETGTGIYWDKLHKKQIITHKYFL